MPTIVWGDLVFAEIRAAVSQVPQLDQQSKQASTLGTLHLAPCLHLPNHCACR